MGIEQQRSFIANLCYQILDRRTSEELDAICANPEGFQAQFEELVKNPNRE
jgi:hypothetical protein